MVFFFSIDTDLYRKYIKEIWDMVWMIVSQAPVILTALSPSRLLSK